MKIKQLSIVITAAMLSQLAQANSLKEISEIAVNNDFKIEQLHNSYLIELEKQNEVDGMYRPHVSFDSDINYGLTEEENVFGEHDNLTANTGIGFNYALYEPEKDSIKNLQSYNTQLSYLNFEEYRQEILFKLSSIYYDILSKEKILETDIEQQKSMQKQHDKIENMVEVGLRTMIDLAEVKSELDQANANVIISQNNLDNSLSQLFIYTGQDNLKPQDINIQNMVKHFEKNGFDYWNQKLQENNFSIKKAKVSKEISKENIEKVKSSDDLSISLNGGIYNNYTHHRDNQFENSANIGVKISLPLYNGGTTDSLTKQAMISYTNSTLDLDYLQRQLKPQLEIVLNELKSIDRQIISLKEVVKSTKMSMDSTQESYNVGVRDIVDVLNATTQYYISLKNLSNTEYDYVKKQNELLYLVGSLEISQL